MKEEQIINLVKVLIIFIVGGVLSNKYSNIFYDGTKDVVDGFLDRFFRNQPLITDYVSWFLKWVFYAPAFLLFIWGIMILISTFTNNKNFKILNNFSFLGIFILYISGVAILQVVGVFLFVFYNESYCAFE